MLGLDRDIDFSVSAIAAGVDCDCVDPADAALGGAQRPPCRAAVTAPDPVPVYSSSQAASPAGTLPRHLPRASAFESGFAKTGRSLSQAGGKLDALPQTIRFTGRPPAAAAATPAVIALEAPQSAHDFEARAPPLMQA